MNDSVFSGKFSYFYHRYLSSVYFFTIKKRNPQTTLKQLIIRTMKKLITSLTLLLMALGIQAQTEKVEHYQPALDHIVVYLEGVEYTHDVPVQLSPGRYRLCFEGLSAKLDPASIRVNTGPALSVLSVTSKTDYLIKSEEKPRIKALRDSVSLISRKAQLLVDEQDALTTEKAMLLKNQSIGGQNNGVSILELQKAADFYASRILEINKRVSAIEQSREEYNNQLSRLNSELTELNAQANIARSEISVLVSAETAVTTHLELSYYLPDAGWAPVYELKSEEIGQPVDLIYRAHVFNNTDVDWKNVRMVLSTGNPTKPVTQPKLNPWRLTYEYEGDYILSGVTTDRPQQAQFQNNLNDNFQYRQQTLEQTKSNRGGITYTTIEVSQLSVEFPITAKYSIPSDSKPYIVDVTRYNLPATYKHTAIPKEDRDAFLLARITGWEDLNLVEGVANVYFAGSYVGRSYIYTRKVADTLDLSFGRDPKVMVTRTKMKEYTDNQLIGSKRKETYRYQIVVKNNRKAPINIEIQDQVPVSGNEEIEVTVEETSKADYNLLSGICKWNYTIEPDKSQSINLQYTVKYPKNKVVRAKSERYRSSKAPSF